MRSIQCLARVKNVTSPVDGALCVDAGLEAPVTIQRCGFTECPQWHFGEWSECESSRCFTLHYGELQGEVCRYVDASYLSGYTRFFILSLHNCSTSAHQHLVVSLQLTSGGKWCVSCTMAPLLATCSVTTGHDLDTGRNVTTTSVQECGALGTGQR